MRITQKIVSSNSICVVTGSVSSADAEELRDYLTGLVNEGIAPIILDMTDCEVIQSEVLYRLAVHFVECALAGSGVRVVASSPCLLRLFDMTRLDAAVDVYGHLESALTRIGNIPKPKVDFRLVAGLK